jgi:hypothetical protein
VRRIVCRVITPKKLRDDHIRSPGHAAQAQAEPVQSARTLCPQHPTEVYVLRTCCRRLSDPLDDLSLAELDALAEQYAAGDGRIPAQDGVGAGFTRDLPGDPAKGFAAGWPLDGLAPGQVLARPNPASSPGPPRTAAPTPSHPTSTRFSQPGHCHDEWHAGSSSDALNIAHDKMS